MISPYQRESRVSNKHSISMKKTYLVPNRTQLYSSAMPNVVIFKFRTNYLVCYVSITGLMMDSHSVSSCHTSSSSLYSDVDTLRSKLDEKDTLLQTAAQYGKDLLDHNRELANSLDETTRKYTRQIEVSHKTSKPFSI